MVTQHYFKDRIVAKRISSFAALLREAPVPVRWQCCSRNVIHCDDMHISTGSNTLISLPIAAGTFTCIQWSDMHARVGCRPTSRLHRCHGMAMETLLTARARAQMRSGLLLVHCSAGRPEGSDRPIQCSDKAADLANRAHSKVQATLCLRTEPYVSVTGMALQCA